MSDFLAKLAKVPSPEQMWQWDNNAVEFGIPDFVLMENAGKACLDCLRIHCPKLACKNIAIFMGTGKNGGDAACLARYLLDSGARPLVFHVAPLENCKGSCAEHVRLAKADGVYFEEIPIIYDSRKLNPWFMERCLALCGSFPDIIVDGLLGTGFVWQLRPSMLAIVESLNYLAGLSRAFVMSIDVPSGLNALSGKASPLAVRADATVSLESAKPGLLFPDSRQWTGQLHVRKIGMPRANDSVNPADFFLLDGRAMLNMPGLPSKSYKNLYGHVLVVGGAKGFSGAVHLSAAAALRAGAGLVTAVSPTASDIKMVWPEIMSLVIQEYGWPNELSDEFLELTDKACAIVVGPGMGRGGNSMFFLESLLYMSLRPPMIFDADALMLMSKKPKCLEKLTDKDIITPHPGEAGALLNCSADEIQQDRPEALRRLSEMSPAVVVLKGAGSLISQKGRMQIICPYDIPQLAIGGSGDVLAGIMGAMMSRDKDALSCAAQAVIIHAIAGLALAKKYPQRGGLASELVNAISDVPAYLMDASQDALREGCVPWPQ